MGRKDSQPVATLVERGLVRRLVLMSGESWASQMIAEVRTWDLGRGFYDGKCARCHGADGSDTFYTGIKALSGIGNRAGEEKILEMTEMAGFVDLHYLNSQQKRALAVFVSGL